MPIKVQEKDILDSMPGTEKQIAVKSGYHHLTIRKWLRILHKAGKCHIKGWDHPGNRPGNAAAVYKAGAGVDAEYEHTPQNPSESWKRQVKKFGRDYVNRRQRTYRWRKKATLGNPDPLMQAFYGKPTGDDHGTL